MAGNPAVQVRVPADLRDRAHRRAEAEGTTLSEVVRSFLERYAPPDAKSLLDEMFPTGK